MPIEALPETTTRALGSTLVLNDAKSVVKELVDNALDARATAISIEVSSNSIDVIQVKDNGTGVDVQDRQLLCKRSCTSKIRSLDDLNRLGGTFLGFRGEALASITELSSAVSVTTRVEGEIVGTALKYTTSGMKSSSSASHPIGTTFRVQDFLTKIPVRRQTALGSANKTLQSIKSLLFAYASARRDVRFSLKVLKSKNEKSDWIYAASRNASLHEVATKIVGKEIVSECIPYELSPTESGEEGIEDGWSLDALLVSPDADVEKIRGGPQFLSVDGRPVSTERGIMKEIVKNYKSHLQRNLRKSASISRPFICMQIQCPSESYDVNVEPAKDEVLFFRPDYLLSLIERLFQKAYGNIDATPTESPGLEHPEVSALSTPGISTTNLQDVKVPAATDQDAPPLASPEVELSLTTTKNPFTIAAMNKIVLPRKMHTSDMATTTTAATEARLVSLQSDVYTSGLLHDTHRQDLGQQEQLPSPTSSDGPDVLQYQNPGPPKRPWPQKNKEVLDMSPDPRTYHKIDDTPGSQQMGLETWLTPQSQLRPSISGAAHRIAQGRRSLPTHDGYVPAPTQSQDRTGNFHHVPAAATSLQLKSGQKPFKTPFKRTMHAPSQLSLGSITPPSGYVSSVADPGMHIGFGVAASPQNVRHHQASGSEQILSPNSDEHTGELADSDESFLPRSELSEIMDFELRKKAAIAHQKRLAARYPPASVPGILSQSQMKQFYEAGSEPDDSVSSTDFEDLFADSSQNSKTKSNPHRNRYLAAKRGFSHSHPERDEEAETGSDDGEGHPTGGSTFDAAPEPSQIHDDDPRAYLIRQKQRQTARKSKLYRAKSSKLPFETIPPHAMTLNLSIQAHTFENISTLKRCARKIACVGKNATSGTVQSFDIHDAMNDDYTKTLREMLKAKYRFRNSEGKELVPHLKITLAGKEV